jgi:hypothetical protein
MFFFVVPQAYAMMFPKSIKESAKPYVTRKELRVMHIVLYPLYLLMFLYMAISAHLAGVSGFWNLFWTGYIEMTFVSISDFVVLDILGRIYVKDKELIKGADKDHPGWKWSEWGKLAVPEHGIFWTFMFCPLTGLIVAGIAALL